MKVMSPPLEEETLSLVGDRKSSGLLQEKGIISSRSGGGGRFGIRSHTRMYTEESNHQMASEMTSTNSTSNTTTAMTATTNSVTAITSPATTSAIETDASGEKVCGVSEKTGGGVVTFADSAEYDLIDSSNIDDNLLGQFHEDAIKQAGVGYFQIFAALCTGLSLAADTVEFFVVPYILPSAEVELCIKDNEKGWLGKITLVGLALGGIGWGGLGDRIGRRRALLSAMSVHIIFSGVATFMPTYGTFMTARFISAMGVSGAIPLAFVYIAECCPHISRSKWTSILISAGALGGVYAALLAWIVVPTTGEMVVLENKEHFSAWHRFLLMCWIPAVCATISLIFIPESPRYLIEAGHDVEAMMVYQRIYKSNTRKNITGAGAITATTQYQLSELELPTKRPRRRGHCSGTCSPPSPSLSNSVNSNNHNHHQCSNSTSGVLADITYSIQVFCNSFIELFSSSFLRITVTLLVIWSAVGFGLYGLLLWCPEYLKVIRSMEYEQDTIRLINKEYINQTFTSSLENRWYKNSIFINCKFTKMVFSHVDFDNCTFKSVEFISIKSSKTHFVDSIIVNSKFLDTDLSAKIFNRCIMENNTKLSVISPCPTLDLDYNIYIEEALHGHLVAQIVIVVAAAFTGYFILTATFQRPKIIGLSLLVFIIAVVCSLILIISKNSALAVLGFEGGLIAIFAMIWTILTFITIELFPTHLRCTAFGLMAAGFRIFGLIGTAIYQTIVSAHLIIPPLLTAFTLAIVSIATFYLPNTNNVFL
ncbi:synaptic vesicle glycoprotein 2B-like [Microplitis mediator]|uniref:synaptic vesicle glycoprotein 2B-like n=1 Tax=Microplitis mediator TaxID=375433 RepID=UPI002554B714|nr:synaptic vesicle glycoprotein 2B-like [Microplitis mediator]XP_057322021.1 synaptic vesicle glycoprotein 2B-like [Microplitis mediator]XP_057322022.1 synaptic vesicle glycoprotein 2B-like [Microplitis mediator]